MLKELNPRQIRGLPRFVGVEELARAVQKHPQTIRTWGYEQGMPYHQPAGRNSPWMIDVAEFQAWVRSRCSSPQDRRR
jgi:hypothetical protein